MPDRRLSLTRARALLADLASRARALEALLARGTARFDKGVDAPALLAIGFAVAWFFYLGYGPTLNPTSIGWMMRKDWSAYFWGFSFFRRAEWSFPLGSVPNLFYPFGTSVGFSDANPWLSLLFKPLSPLLPLDFQFSGMWFLLCYVLQAWFGAKITRTMSEDGVLRALGGALFATTPVLPVRADHVALSGLFLVTAGVWLNLSRSREPRTLLRYALAPCLLLAWAAGTHGYLSAMLLALCLAYYARLYFVDKALSGPQVLALLLLGLVCSFGTSYLFGFIGWKKSVLTVGGFGEFSGDMLSLLNSQGLSRLVPGLPCRPRQWEGFAYLGLGVLGLLTLGLVLSLARPMRTLRALRSQWPLIVVCLGMLVYSWSSIVTYRGEQVADLSAFYAYLWPVPAILRSSGRFGWPAHVALIAAGVAAVASMERFRSAGRLLLLLALGFEIAEHDPKRLDFAPTPLAPLTRAIWNTTGRDYRHLAIVPIQLQWDCPYNEPLVNTLSYLAYHQNLTFNSGNFMGKESEARALCGKGVTAVDPRTVYVVDPHQLADFRRQNAVCGLLDGLFVCVAHQRVTALRNVLSLRPIP